MKTGRTMRGVGGVAWSKAMAVILGVFLATVCCSGGEEGVAAPTTPPPAASFTRSSTIDSIDLVRLAEVAKSGDLLTLGVELIGPTTRTDFWGFSFDLVVGDTGVVTLVENSAEPGDVLDATGCSGISASAFMKGNRIVIGVTKLGNCQGNGIVGAGPRVLLRLILRTIGRGTSDLTFGGSYGQLPTAVSKTGPIAEIVFDSNPAQVTGK